MELERFDYLLESIACCIKVLSLRVVMVLDLFLYGLLVMVVLWMMIATAMAMPAAFTQFRLQQPLISIVMHGMQNCAHLL